MVLTFHVPKSVFLLGISRLFLPVASLWLSQRRIILPEPPFTKFILDVFDVSVTQYFLWVGMLIQRLTPNLEGQGLFLAEFSPRDLPGKVEPTRSQDSRRYSFEDHGDTQVYPPLQGNSTKVGSHRPMRCIYYRLSSYWVHF